jgi:O-antigen ligase
MDDRWNSRLALPLFFATASLAAGPRFLLVDSCPPSTLSWFETLQGVAIFVCLLLVGGRSGFHSRPRPWPVLAVAFMLLQTIALALTTGLDPPREGSSVIQAALALSFPWMFVVVRFDDRDAVRHAHVLMAIPALSVCLGFLLQILGDWSVVIGRWETVVRLQGATRADYLAAYALAGSAIALHEYVGRRSFAALILACTNLVILVFTGGRMGMLATAVWLCVYLLRSRAFRETLRGLGRRLWVGAAVLFVAVAIYLPSLRYRMSGWSDLSLRLSGREEIWAHYFEAYLSRPIWGLGLGAAQPQILHAVLPHQEYLRLLVEGGVVGASLYLLAIGRWTRSLRKELLPRDRGFLTASMVAIAVHALTDNPISATYWSLFLYLGTLPRRETRPSAALSR